MAAEDNQALSEELESINAIYGENTLAQTPSSETYVLSPSFHPTSLRISFPSNYPETIPVVLGPESSSASSKKGDAADFADLARQVLQSCFRAGEPCIFDLIEELKTQVENRDYASTTDPASLSSDGEDASDSASEAGYSSDYPSSSSVATTGKTATLGAASGTVSAVYNALIRTHHVTSRKKVGKVKKMAVHELRYLLIRSGGSPGLMYAEGSEESLKDWISGVSALRYKDYHLLRAPAPIGESRKLQSGPATKGQLQSKSDKLAAVSEDNPGYEEVESVAHFAEAVEKRGVLRWWRQAMGYEETGREIG